MTFAIEFASNLHPVIVLILLGCGLLSLLPACCGFKYHDFCATPPLDMKTRFPLYTMEVDTKLEGLPWAYRQNNTITVSVKALYQKYKIKQLFVTVPSMTKATTEMPAKRIHLGKWVWELKGGVVPLDCSQPGGSFGFGADAVRNLWWYKDGFFNVTAEWDPVNTINNAYSTDLIQFEAYVSPDEEVPQLPPGVFGPPPPEAKWVKLSSDKYINLDYVDLQRWIHQTYGATSYLFPEWALGIETKKSSGGGEM